MRKLIPLAASAAIMLISFILTPPSGEFIVSLPWQAFLTLFMISIAVAGLRRENAYAPLETFAASLEYTVSAIGAIALFAFITAPFLTAPYSAKKRKDTPMHRQRLYPQQHTLDRCCSRPAARRI